ncbi:MAG: hypothetical protein EXR75_09670 [Myxococcales bacterium]|nr:hypothetical protein [Myxococcales bacterium]
MTIATRRGMQSLAEADVSSFQPWFSIVRPVDKAAELRAIASTRLPQHQAFEAIAALRLAIECAPRDVDLMLSLGVLLAQNCQYSESQDTFMHVLDVEPNNLDALLSLAQLCRAGRHLIEALDLLEHARRCHGDVPCVLAALAGIAIDLGDHDSALRLSLHVQAIAPDDDDLPGLMRRLECTNGLAFASTRGARN